MEPITPAGARALRKETIPDEVFMVFNTLISRNLSEGGISTIRQDEVINHICYEMDIELIKFDFKWLNIEDAYRKSGWEVEYNKPTYDLGGVPEFVFKIKE